MRKKISATSYVLGGLSLERFSFPKLLFYSGVVSVRDTMWREQGRKFLQLTREILCLETNFREGDQVHEIA